MRRQRTLVTPWRALACALLSTACASKPPNPTPAPTSVATAPVVGPSSPGKRPTTLSPAERRARLKQHEFLAVLARSARSHDESNYARQLLYRSYPELTRRRPIPQDPRGLIHWWRFVGTSSSSAEFGPRRLVVLPDLPQLLGPISRRRLAQLLCPQPLDACDENASLFLAHAVRRMLVLHELDAPERCADAATPNDPRLLACCEEQARRAIPLEPFAVWHACVRALVPKRTLPPRDQFRLPHSGALVTAHTGFWQPCHQRTAFDIRTGLALSRFACVFTNSGDAAIKWSLSRVPPRLLSEITLFASILDTLQSGPRTAVSFPMPHWLEPNVRTRLAKPVIRAISDASEIHYEIHDVAEPIRTGDLYQDYELQPHKRLLVELLETLRETMNPTCVAANHVVAASRLLDLVATQPLAAETRAEVLRQFSCPRTTGPASQLAP